MSKNKVVVVGLLPQQEKIIKSERFRNLKLKFFDSKDNLQRLASSVAAAGQTVVMMTDFISHKHVDVCKSGSASVRPCPGGLSSLKSILRQLENNEKD